MWKDVKTQTWGYIGSFGTAALKALSPQAPALDAPVHPRSNCDRIERTLDKDSKDLDLKPVSQDSHNRKYFSELLGLEKMDGQTWT